MNEGTTEKLTSGFKALIHDTEEILKTTYSQTGEKVTHLRERLGKQLEEGKRTLGEQERVIRAKALEARTCTESYFREHPWTALGIGAAVGVVIAFLLFRRH